MATRLESSVGLKRKVHIPDYMVKFADDFRDVEIKGGMVAVGIYDQGMEKTKDGKGSGDIELPKTKGGEAESGSKTKGGEAESGSEGSSTTVKPTTPDPDYLIGRRRGELEMEREVAAMATRLESSVGLKRKVLKRKVHIPDYMMEFADDFRDVEIKGGMVAVGIYDQEMEKTKDGKGGGDIELPKTKGGEAESGSKEDGSSTTAKPAGGRKRTKMVKYRVNKSSIPLFNKKPITFNLSLHDEAFAAAVRKFHEFERSILKQFETKGYAEYEREEEVTDDEEDPISV